MDWGRKTGKLNRSVATVFREFADQDRGMSARIVAGIVKGIKWASILLAVAAITFFAIRVYDIQRGPPLSPWHTYVPHELRAKQLDAADWSGYLAEEAKIFEAVRTEVTQNLEPGDRVPLNRYFEGSPIYPAHFAQDFNRSYVLEPAGPPVGAVVLLHGLTDSPYSQRHIARAYRDRGFVAIVIRLPAHGTVPAALTDVEWEDWSAATRLAVREARRRVAPSAPLHVVGFSNGGALALKYALDAIADPQQAMPDRLVLISPMIGITRFARFAGLAGLPAILPAFAEAAWLGIVPEFNPFKYNSFPVNGARQSYRLTQALQEQTARYARTGQLGRLPPIITFQSVMDFTVSTSAIVSALYAHLPSNGSELVLFDVNRTVKFGLLLRRSADTALAQLLPAGPRSYRTTIITNTDDGSDTAVERTTEAGSVTEHARALGLTYPTGLYSLSHVALPFPMTDGLYGLTPDPADNFGINLGALAPRGERNVLIASLDALLRVASNPFFPYMLGRIEEGIDDTTTHKAAAAAPVPTGEQESGDGGANWSFRGVIASILSFMRDQPDSSPAPP
jgi:alpha-beta hydrolase superfamily lysophospholipase